MEENQDVRWLQRYDSFQKACKRVLEITESDKSPEDLSELEQEGLIQRFEYTFELAWKVLQDFLKYKGYEFMQGPNGALQKAFEDGLISNHDAWRRSECGRDNCRCGFYGNRTWLSRSRSGYRFILYRCFFIIITKRF